MEKAALPWPGHIPKYPPTLATACIPLDQLPCSGGGVGGGVLRAAAPYNPGLRWEVEGMGASSLP